MIKLFVLAIAISLIAAVPILLLPDRFRAATFALVFTLVVTPTWAPATIAAVPVPFGFLLIISLAGNAFHELIGLLAMFWEWHLVAFPLVFAASYFSYALIAGVFSRFEAGARQHGPAAPK